MPRPKGSFKTPSLTLHKPSGRARVCIDGKDHYCGVYGTPAAQQQYNRLIAEWILRGRQPVPVAAAEAARGLTVSQVIAAFWTHATSYYADCALPGDKIVGELDNYRLALRPLRRLYGAAPAVEFGPLKLKAVRSEMLKPRVEKDDKGNERKFPGWCRTYANRQVNRLRHVFKWASENELIPPSVHHGLTTVAGLRKGKSEARENGDVAPVPAAHVEPVVKLLPPPVAAMVELQRLTGMRSDEVCSMRGADMVTAGSVWTYTPTRHKNAHRGHARVVHLGPQAQAIVTKHLKADTTAHLFSPADSEQWMREQRAKARETPLSCGTVAGENRKRNPKRRPQDRYTPTGYRRCIARARERAGVPRWHPHQLRHTAATEWRKQYGPEATLVLLGDRTARMLDVYAERDQSKAAEIMAKIG